MTIFYMNMYLKMYISVKTRNFYVKTGASAHIFWNYKTLDVPRAVEKIAELGFDSVEFLCDQPLYRTWGTSKAYDTAREIKGILAEFGLASTLHAPFHNLNIASYNKGVVRETVTQMLSCLKAAGCMESKVVVVHPGSVVSRFFKREDAMANMIKNLGRVITRAENMGIIVCLENLPLRSKPLCTDVEEIRQVMASIDSKSLGVTLDVAHANTTGTAPETYARNLKKHIKHVHLSDNTGSDNHLPIGLGNINFQAVLRELKPYHGILNIEGWMPHNQEYFLRWDKQKLDSIIGK
jgi:sugar phosphate isomerase/epimerase